MRFFLISAGVFALAMPVLALAANYVPLAPIPNLDGGEGATLESYINSLFLLVISVGAMLAVIRVVIGGFQYMTQTASTTATSNARQTIRDAVIGLILLLSVYLILSVVNPQILNLSALKFENLAPSDEVKQQIQENREDAERREAERQAKIEAFAQNFSPYEDPVAETSKLRSEVDGTNMLSQERNRYLAACKTQNPSASASVVRYRVCKNTKTGKEAGYEGALTCPVLGAPQEHVGNLTVLRCEKPTGG